MTHTPMSECKLKKAEVFSDEMTQATDEVRQTTHFGFPFCTSQQRPVTRCRFHKMRERSDDNTKLSLQNSATKKEFLVCV